MQRKILTFIIHGKKLLALYSKPHPKHGEGGWFVVTGAIEKGESAEEAVKREVKEETGLSVKEIFPLNWGSIYRWENKICEEYNFVSFVDSKEVRLNEEHSKYKWLNLDKFIEIIKWDDDKKFLREVLETALKKRNIYSKNRMKKDSNLLKRIRQNTNKGQHFLIDLEITNIASISKKDRVIEIGAGEGNITAKLAKKAEEVLAFEIDKRYAKILNTLEKNCKNLKVIHDNAFNYPWKNYTKIVSNIPYHISEQLINKAIKDEIQEMILIVSERFKKKLAKKQSKIGIISNLFYNIKFITKINKKCFFPSPRVNSWLIKMNRKKKFSNIESLLISILKRKGKLKNAILYSLVEKGKTKKESKKIIKNMNLNTQSLEKMMSRLTGKLLTRLTNELKLKSNSF